MTTCVSVEFPKPKIRQITARLDRHAKDAARAARRRKVVEDLHKEYVVKPLLWRTCRRTAESRAQAQALIAWVDAFEKNGLRTKLQGQFGEGEMPVARAKIIISTPGHALIAALVLEGELRVHIHPMATNQGVYRYVECAEGFIVRQGQDLKTSQDLNEAIHPTMLDKLYHMIACDDCWKLIDDWIEAQSERALRNG